MAIETTQVKWFEILERLRGTGVKRALLNYGAQGDWLGLAEVEFFPPTPEVVAEPIAKQTMPIGADKGMPTDDELMLWSAGGPLPSLETEEP